MSNTTYKWVISKNVDCPVCIAKAGEDCILSFNDGQIYTLSNKGHLDRVEKVLAPNPTRSVE